MEILYIDEKNKVQFLPQLLEIDEFHNLWVNDEGVKKSLFIRQLSYIWFFADFASPYVKQGMSDEEKFTAIRSDMDWKKTMPNKKLVDKAIDKYIELNSTETIRLLEAAQNVINSIVDYYNDINMTSVDKQGKLVNNISQVMTSLKSIGTVNKEIRELKNTVMAEMAQAGHIKGGGQKGMFEDPGK